MIYIDDTAVPAGRDDSVIAALLLAGELTGQSEFDGQSRGGFCLMGACQDCTLWDEQGRRLRACMTPVQDGMRLYRRARLPFAQVTA